MRLIALPHIVVPSALVSLPAGAPAILASSWRIEARLSFWHAGSASPSKCAPITWRVLASNRFQAFLASFLALPAWLMR